MSRPTVLHVLEAANHGTGTARHVLDLVSHARSVQHHVAVPFRSTSRGEPVSDLTARLLVEHGATVHQVPMRRQVVHPDTARASLGVRRLVAETSPDIVHGHSGVGGALARLGHGVPSVYTPNGVHPSSVAAALERRLARRTTAAIAVSRGEARLLTDVLGYPEHRVHVVPNGIADVGPEAGGSPVRLPVPDGAVVVGWIGRHARQKAPEVLVHAAAEVCRLRGDVHVVMAGGGPDIAATRALVERLGLGGRVHLLGFVPDARRLIEDFDVLALPSRWEGAPYVPLEAMAARVPLVLSDCVGNADLVMPGETGWRVGVDDAPALATALLEAVADPDRRGRMANAAHARYRGEYVASRMAERTEAVYDAVLSVAP